MNKVLLHAVMYEYQNNVEEINVEQKKPNTKRAYIV